jgi:hypothetical protein
MNVSFGVIPNQYIKINIFANQMLAQVSEKP